MIACLDNVSRPNNAVWDGCRSVSYEWIGWLLITKDINFRVVTGRSQHGFWWWFSRYGEEPNWPAEDDGGYPEGAGSQQRPVLPDCHRHHHFLHAMWLCIPGGRLCEVSLMQGWKRCNWDNSNVDHCWPGSTENILRFRSIFNSYE